jgi:hypothetical protein
VSASAPADLKEGTTMSVSQTVTDLLAVWDQKVINDTVIGSLSLTDFLLDLHFEFSDHPVHALLQEWINAATRRNIFTADEVKDLLAQIRAQLRSPAAFQINEHLNLR